MSDLQVRELERRWLASGSPDDKRDYLRARLRVGTLTVADLSLLGAVGSVAAAGLVDPVEWPHEPPDRGRPLDLVHALEHRVAGLARWSADAPLQAAVASLDPLVARVLAAVDELTRQIPSDDRERVTGRAQVILGEVRRLVDEAEAFLAEGAAEPLHPRSGVDLRLDPVVEGLDKPVGAFFAMTSLDSLMRAASWLGEAVRATQAPWDAAAVLARFQAQAGVYGANSRPDPLEVEPPAGMTQRSLFCGRVVRHVAEGLATSGTLRRPYTRADGDTHGRDVPSVCARLRRAIYQRVAENLGLAPHPNGAL